MEGNEENLAKLQADDWYKLTRAAFGYGYGPGGVAIGQKRG